MQSKTLLKEQPGVDDIDATELRPLTQKVVTRLLAGRNAYEPDGASKRRRKVARWPFPGQVQLWLPDKHGIEQLSFARCLNLSLHGVGMLFDEPLPAGLELGIAIHQPEASLQGRAIVRHCTETDAGYYIGAQFLFDRP